MRWNRKLSENRIGMLLPVCRLCLQRLGSPREWILLSWLWATKESRWPSHTHRRAYWGDIGQRHVSIKTIASWITERCGCPLLCMCFASSVVLLIAPFFLRQEKTRNRKGILFFCLFAFGLSPTSIFQDGRNMQLKNKLFRPIHTHSLAHFKTSKWPSLAADAQVREHVGTQVEASQDSG